MDGDADKEEKGEGGKRDGGKRFDDGDSGGGLQKRANAIAAMGSGYGKEGGWRLMVATIGVVGWTRPLALQLEKGGRWWRWAMVCVCVLVYVERPQKIRKRAESRRYPA
jgi:hypothetical protein